MTILGWNAGNQWCCWMIFSGEPQPPPTADRSELHAEVPTMATGSERRFPAMIHRFTQKFQDMKVWIGHQAQVSAASHGRWDLLRSGAKVQGHVANTSRWSLGVTGGVVEARAEALSVAGDAERAREAVEAGLTQLVVKHECIMITERQNNNIVVL